MIYHINLESFLTIKVLCLQNQSGSWAKNKLNAPAIVESFHLHLSMGRKAIGIELKDSYYKQAILNMKEAKRRFKNAIKSTELFDELE